MRLLLDSHAALWWVGDDRRLSAVARDVIADVDNEVLISVASMWEIAIKSSKGKLRPPPRLREQFAAEGFSELAVTGDHAWAVAELPLHHRDPFDRLLVAQAKLEKLVLVTADKRLAAYRVATLW